jgi:Flp pilus assembly protein TadD
MSNHSKGRHWPVLAFFVYMTLLGGCATQQIGSLGMLGPVADQSDNAPPESSTRTLYLTIVEGLLDQGRYRAALGYLNQYAVSESANPRFNMLRGEALLGVQQYDDAREAFSALTDTDLAGVGYSGLGRVEAAKGNWSAARQDFAKAVAARPSEADYLNNLGYSEIQIGGGQALSQALFSLQQAQELDPSSPSIRNNLVLALTLAGKDEEAQRVLQSISVPFERAAVSKFAADWVQDKQKKVIE